MGGRVEVGLLGPVEVRVAGAPVALTSLPQRVVLARLGLSHGRTVAVGDLLAALWTGEPPANATGNLHTYVSRLRRAVGADRIAREPGGYRLHAEVDIGRVRRLADDAAAAGDPARAAALLGDALAVWRGEPLADLGDTLAFAPELARLAEWRRQLRDEWLGRRLLAGDAAGALPDLEEAAAAEPLREPLHLLWMRALHATGRTPEALAVAAAFRRRLAGEAGLDPSPALEQLQRHLLTAPPEPPPAAVQVRATRPPPPGDRFVGRAAELAQLSAALTQHRLVTVVGPGGVGKTRLVREVMHRLDGRQSVHLVELAELSVAEEVPAAVAAVLGLRTAPDGSRAAIADRLGREPVLLAVDNCEHLLAAAGDLVADLLARCPDLRVVATSRQRLGLAGERVLRLGPLGGAEQVELFCDRAALLRADFDAAPAARRLVGEICALLDGLPLAVELAARRESVFGLTHLRERLATGLDVLEPARDGDRATAVTAMVEWSYRLLDPDARALFDRLAVCRGGFSLDALDHLAPPGVANPAALLAELVDASLVLGDLTADPPRYRVLEVMRHVGLRHLTPSEVEEARQAHAEWMFSHLSAVDARQRARAPETAPLLRREIANLREALVWLLDSGQWDAAGRLGVLIAVPLSGDPDLTMVDLLHRLTPYPLRLRTEGDHLRALAGGLAAWMAADGAAASRLLTAALDGLGAGDRWVARFFRMTNRMFTGDRPGAEADAEAMLADRGAPLWTRGFAVCCAALICLFTGDRAGAEAWLARDPELLAAVSEVDGFVAYTRGELLAAVDLEAALGWYERAYRQNDAQGHVYTREVAGVARAAALIRLGRHAEAVEACRVMIASLRRAGMWTQLWIVLRLTAELLAALGDAEPASALLAAADADPRAPVVHGNDRERLDALRAAAGAGVPEGGRAGAVRLASLALTAASKRLASGAHHRGGHDS